MERPRDDRGRFLRFRGWLREDGLFKPAIGWETQRVTQREGTAREYTLELIDAEEQVIHSIAPSAERGDCESLLGPMKTLQISGYLPYREGAAAVRFRRGDQVLYRRSLERHPPVVSFEVACVDSDVVRLGWTSTHTAPLVYHVSMMQARRVVTLVYESAQTETTIDLASIPFGGEVRALVLATDGLRSASAMSEPLLLPLKAPRVIIDSPPPGHVVSEAEGLSLIGHAMTPDGRSLADEGLTWFIDGVEEASGTPIMWVPPLEMGKHTILLAWGQEARSQVDIMVRPRSEAEFAWEEAVAEYLMSKDSSVTPEYSPCAGPSRFRRTRGN